MTVMLARPMRGVVALLFLNVASARLIKNIEDGIQWVKRSVIPRENNEDACGIFGHGKHGRNATSGCYESVQTDCNRIAHIPKFCPEECPFAAMRSELMCAFECVKAPYCSYVTPEFAFPNNETMLCDACLVVGCKRCKSRTVCEECFPNFVLESKSVCIFVPETVASSVKDYILKGLMWGAVLWFVVFLCTWFYTNCCEQVGKGLTDDVHTGNDTLSGRGRGGLKSTGSAGSLASPQHIGGLRFGDSPRSPQPAGFGFDSTTLHSLGGSRNAADTIEAAPFERAIFQGRMHRARCKIKDLTYDDEVGRFMEQKSINFWVDLESRYLTGVGLPLFHGWFPFLTLYSLLNALCCWGIYNFSELSFILQTSGFHYSMKAIYNSLNRKEGARSTTGGSDALKWCDSHVSHLGNPIDSAVQHYAFRASVGYLIMWIVGAALSLLHAVRQKRKARRFRERHACLAAYTLAVEGFPPEATDEEEIKRELAPLFGTDEFEVSICYDFRRKQAEVERLLEKVLVHADVIRGTYDHDLVQQSTALGLSRLEKQEVKRWIRGGEVYNSGQVFIAFSDYSELERIREEGPMARGLVPDRKGYSYMPANVESDDSARPPHQQQQQASFCSRLKRELVMPTQKTLPLEHFHNDFVWKGDSRWPLSCFNAMCEPPDIAWEHFGMPVGERIIKIIAGVALIALTLTLCIGVNLLVVQFYIKSYVLDTGSAPTGMLMTALGWIIQLFNWIYCVMLGRIIGTMGFRKKDRAEMLQHVCFTSFCMVGFVYSIVNGVFPAKEGQVFLDMFAPVKVNWTSVGTAFHTFSFHNITHLSNWSHNRPNFTIIHHGSLNFNMQSISEHQQAAMRLYYVLVPGSLFVGYLLCPVWLFIWPYVSTVAELRISERLRQWRGSKQPPLSAREAEQRLEPLGLCLGNDYAAIVTQPLSVGISLFFASGSTWQIYVIMAIWAVLMMPWQRLLQLRSFKRQYSTTNRLDATVLYIWGLPHGTSLAASCFWAARHYGWSMLWVLVAWFGGWAIYAILVFFLVRPLSLGPVHQACQQPALRCDVCAERSAAVGIGDTVMVATGKLGIIRSMNSGLYQVEGDEIEPETWHDDVVQVRPRLCYHQVAIKRRYTWHNCNPVKVLLMNAELPDRDFIDTGDEDEMPVVPYMIGKDYLHVPDYSEEDLKRLAKESCTSSLDLSASLNHQDLAHLSKSNYSSGIDYKSYEEAMAWTRAENAGPRLPNGSRGSAFRVPELESVLDGLGDGLLHIARTADRSASVAVSDIAKAAHKSRLSIANAAVRKSLDATAHSDNPASVAASSGQGGNKVPMSKSEPGKKGNNE